MPGFGCRITAASDDRPTGARSFILNYQASGRQRSMTIGSVGPWKVAEARREAKQIKLDVAKGADPVADKAAARAAPTMADLAEFYRKNHLPKKRPSSRRGDEAMLTNDILPRLQHHKIAEIAHGDVAGLHQKVAERAPFVANRCIALLSKMFSLAVKQGWRSGNPAAGIERTSENKRERYLNPDEIKRLMEVLDKHPGQSANVVRLLLLTGARKSEALTATWSQFDLDAGVWTKPSSHTKTKRVHRIPLSGDALALLKVMRSAEDQRVAAARAKGQIIAPHSHRSARYRKACARSGRWSTGGGRRKTRTHVAPNRDASS